MACYHAVQGGGREEENEREGGEEKRGGERRKGRVGRRRSSERQAVACLQSRLQRAELESSCWNCPGKRGLSLRDRDHLAGVSIAVPLLARRLWSEVDKVWVSD